ncbi:MAG: ABC transporter ATP-binding protein [Protaetiibacter sp.]
MASLLRVSDLAVEFSTGDGPVHAVEGVGFEVDRGETVCVVGESGSGKSVTVLGLLGLIPPVQGRVTRGRAEFMGRDLIGLSGASLREVRGRDIGMVFQDPFSSLNPIQKIGTQLAEAVTVHHPRAPSAEVEARIVSVLTATGFADPSEVAGRYPHQYSGGMRQRVAIAMAMMNNPSLLIADEPTTALDVTTQAQVLDVIRAAQRTTGAATLFITHDLGVVREMADRVVVMYAGRVVESGAVGQVLTSPRHPYTRALLASMPDERARRATLPQIPGSPPTVAARPSGCAFHPRCALSQGRGRCASERPDPRLVDGRTVACHFAEELREPVALPSTPSEAASPAPDRVATVPVLAIESLEVSFAIGRHAAGRRRQVVHAVRGVDLEIAPRETLGLVGESGCGKSTLARTLLHLTPSTGGRILLDGEDVTGRRSRRTVWRQTSMVFQNPYSSLDPRMRAVDIIREPAARADVDLGDDDVAALLAAVGLDGSMGGRYAHEFSGGQLQRVAIARALVGGPRLLVLDEPVSALDVSIQAQILNLLQTLQRERGLAYLFIGHNLAVMRQVSDRIAVMYLGRVVESGTADEIFEHPVHPYTQALLSAIPGASSGAARERIILTGELPSPVRPPSGCGFRTRCWKAQPICAEEVPALVDRGQGHPSACHFAGPVSVGPPSLHSAAGPAAGPEPAR